VTSIRFTAPDGGTCIVNLGSPWPARLGANVVACVLFKGRIEVRSREGAPPKALAHEYYHVVQRRKRSVMYLPWVILGYATNGYLGAKAEVEANEAEDQTWRFFPYVTVNGVTYPPAGGWA
jgi:hypothetical protein